MSVVNETVAKLVSSRVKLEQCVSSCWHEVLQFLWILVDVLGIVPAFKCRAF